MKKVNSQKKLFYILLLWLFIFSIGLVKKYLENDTFYYIKIGKYILEHGIDMLDHFSFHASLAYTYPHWLYDVFIYVIYYLGGFKGLYISSIVLFFILIFIIFKCNYKITNSYISSFLSSFIYIIALANFVTARSQLMSFILFALEIYFLEMYVKTKNKSYCFGLVLISLVLCNIHVAVWPFFFILFLPYIAERIIEVLTKKINIKNKFFNFVRNKIIIHETIEIKPLLIVILLSLLTGFITPIGMTPYTYLYKTMIGESQKYIIEHQPIGGIDSIFTIVIFAETILLSLLSKIKLRDLFLLSGVALMSVFSIRHISLLALIGSICFSRIIKYFLSSFGNSNDEKILNFIKKKIVYIPAFIIVIIFSISLLIYQNKFDYVDKTLYPVEAVKYIKENVDIKNARIFNEYNFGSYMLYKDIPVFIDSRADLYTKEFSGLDYDIFVDFFEFPLNCDEKIKFYNITHILIYKNYNLNKVLMNKDYLNELYSDDNFILYEVKEGN